MSANSNATKILGTLITGTTGTTSTNLVYATSPTLITPLLGTPTSGTLTNCTGLPISTGVSGLGTGVATFLATPSSANLATAVTDETGSGALVFATSPTLVTPALGTPSALVGTNITGTAAGLTAGTVTTNANLTGPITSTGNATAIASQTGTGTKFVVDTSPTLVTPNIGVATGTSLACSGVMSTGANSGTNGQITFSGSTSGTCVVKTAAAAGTGTIFQLPATNGTNTYVLQTNGSGVTSWVPQSGGGGSPGGADTNVQFNDSSAFGGVQDFTWDKTTQTLSVNDSSVAGPNVSTLTPTDLIITNSSDIAQINNGNISVTDGTNSNLSQPSSSTISSSTKISAFGINVSGSAAPSMPIGFLAENITTSEYYEFGEGGTKGIKIVGNNGGLGSDSFIVDQTTAGTGLKIQTAAFSSGITLSVLSSTASESMILKPKGTGAITVQMGGSSSNSPIILGANVNTTAVGNVGGGTDDLITYSLPASSMNVNGRGVRITAWGTTANNVNAKTVTLNFGSAVILTNALTTSVAGFWRIQAEVFRTGSNTQDYNSILWTTGTAGVALNDLEGGTATQTDSSAITIKCTGAATSNNDIVQEGMLVEMIN